MKTLHTPTDEQRVAFEIMERIYKNDLAIRAGGWPWPPSHPDLCRALRALDRIVGFPEPDVGPPGEGCRRWQWHVGQNLPMIKDRMPGSILADNLLYAAGSRAADESIPLSVIMNRELRRLLGPIEGLTPAEYGDDDPADDDRTDR